MYTQTNKHTRARRHTSAHNVTQTTAQVWLRLHMWWGFECLLFPACCVLEVAVGGQAHRGQGIPSSTHLISSSIHSWEGVDLKAGLSGSQSECDSVLQELQAPFVSWPCLPTVSAVQGQARRVHGGASCCSQPSCISGQRSRSGVTYSAGIPLSGSWGRPGTACWSETWLCQSWGRAACGSCRH